MAMYGVSLVAQFTAWDTSANAPKTGDNANFTLRWVKDGTSSATSNASSEIDATNAKGEYKITMTATEAQCLSGTICGVSSTANIAIIPKTYTFDQLPNATPGSAGGLALEAQGIKKNTARTITVPIVSSTDHITPQTGLTITATRSIDGAAFAAGTVTVTEIGATGYYAVAFLAADLNGDNIAVNLTPTTAAGDRRSFTIVTVA